MKNFFLSILVSISCYGCMSPTDTSINKKPLIVCTTGIIGDMVSSLVDTMANVQSLMGPGVDPHLYKVTQGDLQLLTQADIIIYNGLHLEGKMGDILEKLGQTKEIFAVTDGIDPASVINSSGFIGGHDPHIWFDVNLWLSATEYTKNKLTTWKPEWENMLSQSFSSLATQYTALDAWAKTSIKSIPASKRILVTAHDAFEYFSRAYNIQVEALQGISTMSEFGLKDVIDLVDFINIHKIPAVFIESSVPVKSLQAVVEGCQAKGHNLVIGGSLFSDALGASDTPEGTYFGMVKHNVNVIVTGLSK
jgi:manganese/zinc/iron transport system substrate-binding protein